MGAFVKHKFRNGFFLNEERIRKLDDILRRRLKDYDETLQPNYKVYRSDSFSYSTTTFSDVLNEENSPWRKIVQLIISVHAGEKLRVDLNFDIGGTDLKIEGENRDLIYLLFSDLREYVSHEVDICKDWAGNLGAYMVIIGFMVTCWVLITMASVNDDKKLSTVQTQSDSVSVLENQDIQKKLNYLIENQLTEKKSNISQANKYVLLIPILVLLIGFALGNKTPLNKAVKYFFPYNEFVLGKEIVRYEKRMSAKNKLYWGLGIAMIVNIAAGLLVWLLTR